MKNFFARLPRPTRLGWTSAIVFLVLIIAGIQARLNFLLLYGCLGFGLLAACFFLCASNLRNLTLQRRIPYPLFAGRTFRTVITFKHSGRILPAFLVMVKDCVEGKGRARGQFFSGLRSLPAGGTRVIEVPGRFFKRGLKQFSTIELSSTFPLGFFTKRRTQALKESMVVFPRIRAVDRSLFPRDQTFHRADVVLTPKGREEIAGLREFRPGDNPKWIHWKSSARLEERLLVKEFEGTALRRVSILFDTCMQMDARPAHRSFERAVNFAASLVFELRRRQFVVDFCIWGFGEKRILIPPGGRSFFSLFHELALLEPVFGKRPGRKKSGRKTGIPLLLIRPADFRPAIPLNRTLKWT